MSKKMHVEVAYALKDKQLIVTLELVVGSTLENALKASGIEKHFPMIDLKNDPVGIFSKLQKRSTILAPDDRVEIYRPLIADPKALRRNRAEKQAKLKKQTP